MGPLSFKIYKKLLFLFTLLIASFTHAYASTILVTNVLSNSVTLFDEETHLPIKEIKVGFMPHEVVVSPDGKYALVSNFGDLAHLFPGNSVTYIDIENATVAQTIRLPDKSRPHGIAFLSDSQALITAQGIQSLLQIDLGTGTIVKTLALPGAGAHIVIVDAAKRFAYVANTDSGTICKIDLGTFTVVAETIVGKDVEGLALTKEEDLILGTDRKDNYVAVINTQDLSLLKTIKTDIGPTRVFLFNDGRSAVVANTITGNLQIIDIASLAITNTFKSTASILPLPVPVNVSIRNDGVTAFVTNSFINNIAMVDLVHAKVIKEFPSKFMPDGIAISSATAVKTDTATDAVFNSGSLDIDANIETVWQVAKNVEDYNRLSNGAITAHIEGPIMPGKTIQLWVYKDKFVGKFIPPSTETITIVDEDRKILAWMRKLPDGKFTERYQFLEKISDNKTRSTIVLYIPGLIGEITKHTLGETITKAFIELNDGIKKEAESRHS